MTAVVTSACGIRRKEITSITLIRLPINAKKRETLTTFTQRRKIIGVIAPRIKIAEMM